MEKDHWINKPEELLTAYFRGELEGPGATKGRSMAGGIGRTPAAVPPDQCGYVVLAMEPERMETRFL